MSGVTLPVTRPKGRALIVGSASSRPGPLLMAQQAGFGCAEADDPYQAMAQLCRRPLVHRAVVLSLASVYHEELLLVQAVKRRFPHVEIWLAHTDGRAAALAEALRLGADGLLAEDGLHLFAPTGAAPVIAGAVQPEARTLGRPAPPGAPALTSPVVPDEGQAGEDAVLTAEELKALLADEPVRHAADDF